MLPHYEPDDLFHDFLMVMKETGFRPQGCGLWQAATWA